MTHKPTIHILTTVAFFAMAIWLMYAWPWPLDCFVGVAFGFVVGRHHK